MTTDDGRVVTPAGTHQRCRELATAKCPHLRGAADRLHDVEVTPEMIVSGGRPLAEVRKPLSWQDWTLAGGP